MTVCLFDTPSTNRQFTTSNDLMPQYGTKRTCRRSRCMSAVEGMNGLDPDAVRFPKLTQLGHSAGVIPGPFRCASLAVTMVVLSFGGKQ